MDDLVIDWIVVSVFGAVVGVGEIVARYRGEPVNALKTAPALLYIFLNALVSLLALAVTRLFGWTFGADETNVEALRWTQVIVSGMGALVVLRASFFTVKAGDEEVAVGPGPLLRTIFDAVDREVDRAQAEQRALSINRIMADVSFERAYLVLPAYCFALLENLSKEEQKQFGDVIKDLKKVEEIDVSVKNLLLGAQLINLVGEEVLEGAVKGLGEKIK